MRSSSTSTPGPSTRFQRVSRTFRLRSEDVSAALRNASRTVQDVVSKVHPSSAPSCAHHPSSVIIHRTHYSAKIVILFATVDSRNKKRQMGQFISQIFARLISRWSLKVNAEMNFLLFERWRFGSADYKAHRVGPPAQRASGVQLISDHSSATTLSGPQISCASLVHSVSHNRLPWIRTSRNIARKAFETPIEHLNVCTGYRLEDA